MQKSNRKGHLTLIERDKITILKSEGLSINKELNIKSYFCKLYHSWEKGTVENINGLIRRFFPKGTDFDNISEVEIQYVQDWINNRPMKILNYLTPNEKLQELGVVFN